MAHVITLCSLGGNTVSIPPDALVEVSESEATALVENRMARKLIKGEPTPEQEATKFSLLPVSANVAASPAKASTKKSNAKGSTAAKQTPDPVVKTDDPEEPAAGDSNKDAIPSPPPTTETADTPAAS